MFTVLAELNPRGGLVTRQELLAQLAARREHSARARAHVDDRDLTCSRCGRPAEPGSELYRETLCNRCALELGQQEVAARQAASADVCKPGAA